jgi:steroid delta-isomerase-like uncharacterized protein
LDVAAEENAALARRWIEVWDRGDEAALDDLYAPDFVYHMRFPGQEPGLAGEKQVVRMLHRAFPDLRIEIDDLIVDEHNAVVRWSMPCTHLGVFRGIEPNGRPVRFTGMDILRVENGRVVARWDEVNNRGAPPYV